MQYIFKINSDIYPLNITLIKVGNTDTENNRPEGDYNAKYLIQNTRHTKHKAMELNEEYGGNSGDRRIRILKQRS